MTIQKDSAYWNTFDRILGKLKLISESYDRTLKELFELKNRMKHNC